MNIFGRIAQKIRDLASTRGYVCDCCGAEIFEYPVKRLCDSCAEALMRNDGLRCAKCGRKTVSQGICLNCKAKLPLFTRGLSPLVYGGETASLVNRIKNGNRRLAYFFAEEMSDVFLRSLTEEDLGRYALNVDAGVKNTLLVVPVPLTKEKRNTRGYNQAEELAYIITGKLSDAGVSVTLDTELLQKRRENTPQKDLGFAARAKNVAGAYHVHKRKTCQGASILLVDDIMTTGATGSECSKLLFSAGAQEVFFLTAVSLPERAHRS